ncbi:MAG: hypothetical protein KKB51_20750 [Candidatus Riflebacteria bacterium]|nr:hypothetical protein [Candidatus Riflebacteria bacterium]
MNKQIITSETSWLVRLAPILLWVLVILLPVITTKVIFTSALAMEKQLYRSRMRQKLQVELQKYETALKPEPFFHNDTKMRKYEQILQGWLNNENVEARYRNCEISSQLPDFSEQQDEILKKLDRLSQKQVGTKPALLYIIAENQKDCFWRLKPPLSLPVSDDEFRGALSNAWQIIDKRRRFGLKQIPAELSNFAHTPLLNKTAGSFIPFNMPFASMDELFSYLINDALYYTILVVPDFVTNNGNRYILTAFCKSDLSPHFMLKRSTESFSNSAFTHKFGLTSRKILPVYEENESYMALTGETPKSLTQLSKFLRPKDQQPAIRVSCNRESTDSIFKKKIVNFALSLIVITSAMLLTAIQLGRVTASASLHRLVMAGFLTGMILPLSASIWLGICHMNSKQQLEAEQMLDFMQQQIALFEQKILLQKFRTVLFNNIFTRWTGSLPIEQLRNFNQITGYSDNLSNIPRKRDFSNALERHLPNYFFIHPDIDKDIIGMPKVGNHARETMMPVFLSPTRDVLFKLGAFNHIASDKRQQLQQRSELTMGLIDEAVDMKLLSRLYAEEGIPLFNTMTTGREDIGCYFWKNKLRSKIGVMFLQSKRGVWNKDIVDLIKDKKIKSLFNRNGYEMTIRLYFTNAHRYRILDPEMYDLPTSYGPNTAKLWETAQAMLSVSQASRINNLDSAQPQLLAGQTIVDGQAYLLAHAVPIPTGIFTNQQVIFTLLSLLAFIISYVLARGVTWLLMRSIPVFQKSILEMTQQNYLWQIKLQSGDEFDKLALTFNKLTRQLHEREQISQLVSRNVLDAINSGDDQMLKPGGSRVTASILFSDIRSFTTLTEKHPPEKIVAMLNDYFSLMAEKIEEHGGIIDKLIGDAIQAVFYHHECENCAESAVKAGLAMREALAEFNQQRQQNGFFTIDNGVGIATGSVICGRVGSEHGKLDATVIGKLVGQSSHLESLSKFGCSSKVFIDKPTAEKLSEKIKFENRKINDTILVIEVKS